MYYIIDLLQWKIFKENREEKRKNFSLEKLRAVKSFLRIFRERVRTYKELVGTRLDTLNFVSFACSNYLV